MTCTRYLKFIIDHTLLLMYTKSFCWQWFCIIRSFIFSLVFAAFSHSCLDGRLEFEPIISKRTSLNNPFPQNPGLQDVHKVFQSKYPNVK